jgi:hypothetical protein
MDVTSETPRTQYVRPIPFCIFWDIERIKEWMREERVGVHTKFPLENGRTLLHLVIENIGFYRRSEEMEISQWNWKEHLQKVIHIGFDIHAKNNEGLSSLHLAAKSNFVEAILVLLENGADIEEPTKIFQYTPLYLACIDGNIKAIKTLLEKGANVNAVDMVHCPILFCTRIGSPEIIGMLLDYGASLDYEDAYGRKWDTKTYSCAKSSTRKAIRKWLEENSNPIKEPECS